MEDQILTDNYRTGKVNTQIRKQDKIYTEILLEVKTDRSDFDRWYTYVLFDLISKYERLQNQERDLLREMYDLQIQLPPPAPIPVTIEVKNSVDTGESQKGLFEDLQRRNLRLERERFGKYLFREREKTIYPYVYQILYWRMCFHFHEVIQQKLEELISNNYQPSIMSNYEPYRFLREMKEQHELNEKALHFLRGRLIYSDR